MYVNLSSQSLGSSTTSRDVLISCSIQVNIPAESGEMGVLANHVPSIEQLKPGLIEVIEEKGSSKKFFRAFENLPYAKESI